MSKVENNENSEKPSNTSTKSEDLKEYKYEGDIRALILAHIFHQKTQENAKNKALSGIFGKFYQKTKQLRGLLMFILVALFFLHKPEWCLLKPDMDKNCERNAAGVNYYLMLPVFLDSEIDSTLGLLIMAILFTVQYLLVMNIPGFLIERKKLYYQGTFFMIAFVLRLCIFFHLIIPTNMENTMKIFFLLFSFSSVIRTLERTFGLLKYVGFILGLLFVNVILFGLFFRVYFKNKSVNEHYDDTLIYEYSFTSIYRSCNTLFMVIFFENVPNIIIDVATISNFACFVLYIYIIITSIIIISLLTGIFFFIYNYYYVETYHKVCQEYPSFENSITDIISNPFTEFDQLDKVVQNLQSDEQFYHKKDNNVANRARKKVWRVIKKIALIKKFGMSESRENFYTKTRKGFIFTFFDFSISFYNMTIPITVNSLENNREYTDYLFLTELLALALTVDNYLSYVFEYKNKKPYLNFYNICELISNCGIAVLVNLMFLRKIDINEDARSSDGYLLIFWQLCCVLKVVRINDILLRMINYKIVIRTIVDIYPLISDLISMYLIMVLIFATLCMSFYGGKINDSYLDIFEAYAGVPYNENFERFNFNDIVSGCLKVLSMSIVGYCPTINDIIILTYHQTKSKFLATIANLIALITFVIMELIIVNIIVGIIITLTGVYIDNTKHEKEIEEKLMEKKGIFDVILNLDVKINDERNLKIKKKAKKQMLRKLKELMDKDIVDKLIEDDDNINLEPKDEKILE